MQASWRRGILITSFDSQISSEVCMAKASKPVNKTVKISDKGLPIDIGISDKDRAAVAVELSKMLADSYTLYMMTHNFHWKDRKSTRLNSSHSCASRMPSSA